MLPKIMYISQGRDTASHLDNIGQALDAGIQLVQLRLKGVSEDEYVTTAIETKRLCDRHGALLIVNDHIGAAEKSRAFGLHLGLNDAPPADARKVLPDAFIGGTANTFSDVQKRSIEGVNYIGLGPYRFTSTKEKLSPVLGLQGYEEILKKMEAAKIEIPVYAIGGILTEDVEELLSCGVYGIAISGLITNATDKKQTVQQLHETIRRVTNR